MAAITPIVQLARQSRKTVPAAARSFSQVYTEVSSTAGIANFPHVNSRYQPDYHKPLPELAARTPAKGASTSHWDAEWNKEDIHKACEDHVMLTWGPSGPAKDLPKIVRSEGVYLYDETGHQMIDWTSQAMCVNLGHTVPQKVQDAVAESLKNLPFLYSGLATCPMRSRLSKLMSEVTPGDITGFLFPCGGAEANEAAIRMARRYTGRHKILNAYRSYHGGTAVTGGATGDFRRWFSEAGVTGFVKMFNPQPHGFSWGATDEEATRVSLQALEDQILTEGPNTIAAIMLESIVGTGGVLVPPNGWMQGVRALCDKYDILLILDEVMAGFGRTGELWAFEHFDGVLPDIVTSAKGLASSYLPVSIVGCREYLRKWFLENPIGWGATFQAHPVTMAAAYECVKYMLDQKIIENARNLQPVMYEEINALVQKHSTVKAGRAIGLFGCIDLCGPDGRAIVMPGPHPPPPCIAPFRKALRDNGMSVLFRPPLLHCAPPLVITEDELRDGYRRLSASLEVLDREASK